MCNDKTCPALHQVIHRFLNLNLRSGIYRRSRLIQNQYLIICKDCSRNRQKLLLSLRYIACILIQFHLIATRQSLDKMMCSRCFCCRNNLFIRCIQLSVTDILHNCAFKQPGILQYHSKCVPQLSPVEISDIMIIQTDGSTVHIIETHQQFDHRCLTSTGRSHNRNLLSRFNLCAEVMDNHLLRIITKLHMFKTYLTGYLSNISRMFRNLHFLFFSKELKYSLRCCRHRLHHIDYLCNLLDRLCKVLDILDKRLNITNRNHTPDCQKSSCQCHACISQITNKHHDRMHHS